MLKTPERYLSLLVLLAGCSAARAPARHHADAEPDAQPAAPDARVAQPCVPDDQIEDPTCAALTSFFEGLRRAEASRADGRVCVVQFGDSHTAIDYVTSRMRRDLQKRFGDAGRGLVLAGRPVKYYDQRDAFFDSKGTWKAQNGLHSAALEPFGIAGIRNTSSDAGARITVGTCDDCEAGTSLSRFEVFYRPLPDGGTMKLFVDDQLQSTVSTRSDATTGSTVGGYVGADVEDGPHRISVEVVGDGSVELFGVVMERDAPGVVLDALGVGGIEARNLERWDWTYIGEQLARRDPRLVILAYGTNETGRADELTPEWLLATYQAIIEDVKAAAPGASILVLGPPDKNVRERRDCEDCEWKTPDILPVIIDAERQAALAEGVAFFDVYRFMGGAETMERWANLATPLARRDHTHLTRAGYELVADALYDALMRGYERYLKEAPESRSPSR